MNFKDTCNRRSNQTLRPENVVHSSNLCTEIVEVTSAGETAVCNLGSINLARHVDEAGFNFDLLAQTARTAVRFLDAVIDINLSGRRDRRSRLRRGLLTPTGQQRYGNHGSTRFPTAVFRASASRRCRMAALR
jgi:hypothetical protein